MSNFCLDEEIRDGYIVTSKMKKVWEIELDLVQQLIQVCKKHNLKCWIDAGTLLGAVRHKGFIPWDDDIDMVMFRDDYDKLVKISQEEFKKPYFFQTAYSDKDYIRGHAQLRNIYTTAILKSDIGKPFNQGIFIDIFVLDGVSEDKSILKKQELKLRYLTNIMSALIDTNFNRRNGIKYTIVQVLARCLNLKQFRLSLFSLKESILRKIKVENVKYVALLAFVFETNKRIRNKHIYDQTVLLDFEHIKLPAPFGYDDFLTQRYGNYMQPAQLPTTHGEVLFDTERACSEVMETLMKNHAQFKK